MKLKAISFSDLFDHPLFADLCIEYAQESGNADLGVAVPNSARYLMLEEQGLAVCVGAFEGEDMIGFAAMILSEHPHYSATIVVCDALFIKKEQRKGPAGLRLISKVKEMAKEHGAVGVYFSAPEGSRLSKLFARLFTPTDRVYWAKTEE